MRLIKTLLWVCGILFICFTVLPAVVGFLIPAFGALGILIVVVGAIWFVGRLIIKGGGS